MDDELRLCPACGEPNKHLNPSEICDPCADDMNDLYANDERDYLAANWEIADNG